MTKNNKKAFGITQNKKHMTYLTNILIQALSKIDIKTGNLTEGINFLDENKKLTENDKRFIIFSIGVNIGMCMENLQDQQNHYR